ncbi:MAG: aldehyde ferredoxin oxidoreductase family protein [Promethearchaeota archaeon]
MRYKKREIDKGYANQTLYVNLSSNTVKIKPVTKEMKDKFIGGKGFNLWLMWNSLPIDRVVKWDDPENEICIASGPLGGTVFYPGSGKSIVTTISPLTGIVIDSNVGGFFGPFLKFSGFDAIEVQGKAKEDTIIFIDGVNNLVRLERAPPNLPRYSHELTQELTRKYALDDSDVGRSRVSVVSTGPGAEFTRWGCLNSSFYSLKRKWASYKQAGRGGIGTVFKNKKITAIVCRSPRFNAETNKPADFEAALRVGRKHSQEIIKYDPVQNEMRVVGSSQLAEIMNKFDLLPTENFRFGSYRSTDGKEFPLGRDVWRNLFTRTGNGADGCWYGCMMSCSHYKSDHVVLTGPFKGKTVVVDGPEYETIGACGSNIGVWDPKWIMEMNFYCDTYGIDTISFGVGVGFVMECYEAGILSHEDTGGLDLKFGNAPAVLELLHQMAEGKGFGLTVGQGIKRMKKIFAEQFGADPEFLKDIGMEHKGLEFSMYVTKESLAQQGGYGLTLKGPQHDEAWLIFEDIVRHSIPTFEDKARALCWFPYWRTWFGLNGLCKLPWNDVVPPDNNDFPIIDEKTGNLVRATIPKHVKWYAEYFSAVTGIKSTPDDLIKMSERVYNFQRIFNIRQGKGLYEHDAPIPYRAVGPVTPVEYEDKHDLYDKELVEKYKVDIQDLTVSEKITTLRKNRMLEYRKLQETVYRFRGWSRRGCPTIEKVKRLEIDYKDVLKVIEPYQT